MHARRSAHRYDDGSFFTWSGKRSVGHENSRDGRLRWSSLGCAAHGASTTGALTIRQSESPKCISRPNVRDNHRRSDPDWFQHGWACGHGGGRNPLIAKGLFVLAPAFYMEGFEALTPAAPEIPICIVHGWHDEIVPVENSHALRSEAVLLRYTWWMAIIA